MSAGWHIALAAVVLIGAGRVAQADSDRPPPLPGQALTATDGAQIYQSVCQGCHMPDARGAAGAGVIPGLAGNRRLAGRDYPVLVVLHGLGGMPWMAPTLDNQQVAAVVNYLRGHFGNHYQDPVTADEVGRLRGPPIVVEH